MSLFLSGRSKDEAKIIARILALLRCSRMFWSNEGGLEGPLHLNWFFFFFFGHAGRLLGC